MLQLISEIVTALVAFVLIWLAMLAVSVVVILTLAALALSTLREQDGAKTSRR